MPMSIKSPEPLALAVSLSRFTSRVGGGSAFFVKRYMFADVIFPAAAGAYVMNLFVPLSAVLALATEFGVYVYFQRGIISLWRLFLIVFGVNIFSWLVGAFLSCLVPDRFFPHLPAVYALAGYSWACFVSIVLEYFGLWIFRRRLAFRRLGLCVTIANVAGYIVIWITVLLCEHFQIFTR